MKKENTLIEIVMTQAVLTLQNASKNIKYTNKIKMQKTWSENIFKKKNKYIIDFLKTC